MKKLLITGFDSFGENTVNPSRTGDIPTHR